MKSLNIIPFHTKSFFCFIRTFVKCLIPQNKNWFLCFVVVYLCLERSKKKWIISRNWTKMFVGTLLKFCSLQWLVSINFILNSKLNSLLIQAANRFVNLISFLFFSFHSSLCHSNITHPWMMIGFCDMLCDWQMMKTLQAESKALIMFSGMIQFRMSGDVHSKLLRLEVYMN